MIAAKSNGQRLLHYDVLFKALTYINFAIAKMLNVNKPVLMSLKLGSDSN